MARTVKPHRLSGEEGNVLILGEFCLLTAILGTAYLLYSGWRGRWLPPVFSIGLAGMTGPSLMWAFIEFPNFLKKSSASAKLRFAALAALLPGMVWLLLGARVPDHVFCAAETVTIVAALYYGQGLRAHAGF